MALDAKEQNVAIATAKLPRSLQTEVAGLFGAKGFDIALLATPEDRRKLADWVESRINEAPGLDIPSGLAELRVALRQLRVSRRDMRNTSQRRRC
jgi:hypothetical protein